jgi:hypothetical protein
MRFFVSVGEDDVTRIVFEEGSRNITKEIPSPTQCPRGYKPEMGSWIVIKLLENKSLDFCDLGIPSPLKNEIIVLRNVGDNVFLYRMKIDPCIDTNERMDINWNIVRETYPSKLVFQNATEPCG